MRDLRGSERPAAEACTSGTRRRLAVLIPVFNDQEGLERSLNSLERDGSSFDVFVVDDGSAPAIRIPPGLSHKVHLVRQEPNQGITSALNKGAKLIANADYEYLGRLDAGDLSLPGRLSAQMNFLDGHPQHAAVGTASRHVDTGGKLLFDFYPPVGHADIMRTYRYRAAIIHAAVVMRTRALVECGFYREGFPGGEDYDLFMRLGKTHRLANMKEKFIIVEMTSSSITSNRRAALTSRLRLLLEHFDPTSIHAYLGVASNLIFLMIPRSFLLRVRTLHGRWRARGAS